ncbi:MAG: DUF488 family protein [Alphaproteobacteria bacterium]|nr:DUF488 family protein [Alphaproteobacteria bacterium]MDE2165193.1 DUF488 family protein [Alphaproteobacteria bacterium]
MTQAVKLRRVYDPPSPRDGMRVLVDRIWPRGLTKRRAHIDLWLKEVAPSARLRQWFGHDPVRWTEFRRRYRAELARNPAALEQLRQLARVRRITLVFGARDQRHNQAVVLKEVLAGRHARRARRAAPGR